MLTLFIRLWRDDRGLVISAELILVLTLGVLAVIVGLSSVANAVNQEMNDLSSAIGSLDQSYFYRGLHKFHHAGVSGSGFTDRGDLCDCSPLYDADVVHVAPGQLSQGPVIPHPCPEEPCEEVEEPCDGCGSTEAPLEPIPTEELPPLPGPPDAGAKPPSNVTVPELTIPGQ